MNKIAMIVASSNFRDEELLKPIKLFKKEGYEVDIISSKKGEVKGVFKTIVIANKIISEMVINNYDAIVFIGGIGAKEYLDNKDAHKIAQDSIKSNKLLAAICLAPCILANAGVLNGKKCTCYPTNKELLLNNGANFTGKSIEQDGNIITGKGPSESKKFAKTILKMLKNTVR